MKSRPSIISLRSDATGDSLKLVPEERDSPPPKPRSERAVSFSEIVTNHHDNAADDMEMAEVTISFKEPPPL